MYVLILSQTIVKCLYTCIYIVEINASIFRALLSPGTVRDNLEAGVFEAGLSKIKQLKFATEAAITILR